jgi:hypothetical protein
MAELASRMKRKRESRQSPKASVTAPATTRMRLKTVRTLARTMLAVDRLVAGGSTGPRSASRRSASACARPLGGVPVRDGSVSVRTPRLHRLRGKGASPVGVHAVGRLVFATLAVPA